VIISRTPFRISFFGGGTDYPAWYREHGGAVLTTTIDKYCYLSCRYLPPFFEHRIRLVYSKIENCQSVDEINHPAVREVLRYLRIDRGVEIHHDGDLPARSGMGSSSAFTVGLLNALYALKGQMANKQQLAKESIEVEQDWLKENVGSQDQVATAYGGLNHISFLPNGEISVRPITITVGRIKELNSHLMLFYTGIARTSSAVAESYVNNVDNRKRQLRVLKDLVDESVAVLNGSQNIRLFGDLLHEGWLTKRELSAEVTNSHIDEIYDCARSAGALGGKLLGAGGGGFILFFAPPETQPILREKLSKLICVPFEFEFSGSQIIFFDPEADYSAEEKDRANREIGQFQELTGLKTDQLGRGRTQ
jgi:D-glycero-alpha-D-manno-heptose-7-phosphate kinase